MPRKKTRRPAGQGEATQRVIRALEESGGDGWAAIRSQKDRWKLPRDPERLRELADVCRSCGAQGHWERECPDVVCLLCGEAGHMKRSCPSGTPS